MSLQNTAGPELFVTSATMWRCRWSRGGLLWFEFRGHWDNLHILRKFRGHCHWTSWGRGRSGWSTSSTWQTVRQLDQVKNHWRYLANNSATERRATLLCYRDLGECQEGVRDCRWCEDQAREDRSQIVMRAGRSGFERRDEIWQEFRTALQLVKVC